MSKRSILSSDKGFTIMELMIASSIGLVMIGLTVAATLANKNLYQYDLVRSQLNQNIKTALNLLGTNVREAGENLPPTFPAVEVINGASGAPDEIIVRRNILDEILKVCQALTAGSSADVYFAVAGSVAGCTYSDQTNNYTRFQEARNEAGGSIKAYIYDPITRTGEFFDYIGETDTGFQYYIERGTGSWENDYDTTQSSVYLIEEWRFRLEPDATEGMLLQIVENGDDANPKNVIWGLEDMQVQVLMEDATLLDEFDPTDNWVDIQTINVTLSGQDTYTKTNSVITSSLTAQFFPRNVLSN